MEKMQPRGGAAAGIVRELVERARSSMRVVAAYDQGKIDEAIVALNRAVQLDPKEFEAQWALGRALALKGSYSEAIESFQHAVAIAPERSDAHYQLGLALKRVGRTQEADREFATVERLNREFRTNTKP